MSIQILRKVTTSIQNQLKRLQESRAKQHEEKQQPPCEVYVQNYEPSHRYYLSARYPHYYPKYNFRHYVKHSRHKKLCCNKPIVEKRRSGISQQVRTNRTKSVFTASR